MVGKHGRCFRKHHFHIRIGQRFAFQVTEILRLADDPFAGAETFFAAQIQGKLGAELAAQHRGAPAAQHVATEHS